ncbi:hypothetical protein BDP55DRAFT_562243 [Colletotrichum godetiae]|uniref:HeH/LEM domain-containing protein n=1 Tax=Colletotrichum godetiae TaxID=1209918 RepID=A0AAJ0AAW8_9PEZI|nr:uncharacterized protein BDP55DRAFT_568898 [Colletotrichum godetiae]XP_060424544.1 uncharacterized protein BDP55DRAFT_562243 [Colletotrichum godetiae]KAK1656670.1 hypothetical protein BDP55DRAFT_568898 [Colletotrichum godetiae]KAK1659780.1 hypothetical protein BDP55DRAFT_562243 [Colletotrichum godetiae]
MDSTQPSHRKQTRTKPPNDEAYAEAGIVEADPYVEENSHAATAIEVLPGTRVVKHKQTSQTSFSRTRPKRSKRENEPRGTSRSVPAGKYTEDPLETIPSLDDNVDYLQPGFDANSITVKELKKIFVTHGIKFDHSSKKENLVALFQRKIEPRASATLKKRANIKRSAAGIVDVR